jgi:hypothetical protein
MNLVIIGNIESGKEQLLAALTSREGQDAWRCYDIDQLRARYSDATYAGDVYCWSLLLRAAQHEVRGVFSFYGDEPCAEIFDKTVALSINRGGAPWLGIRLRSNIEAIGGRITSDTTVPFPHLGNISNTQKLILAEQLESFRFTSKHDVNSPYPMVEVDTSKYELTSALLLRDLLKVVEDYQARLPSRITGENHGNA